MSWRSTRTAVTAAAGIVAALLWLGAATASTLPETASEAPDSPEPVTEHAHEPVTETPNGVVPGAELLPTFTEEENRKLTAWALKVQAKVEKQWKQPPQSASRHPVQVSIELLANGSIANVRVTQTSGDAELDRSVLIAVLKSGPLPPLKDKALFEKVRHKVVFSFRANGSLKKTSAVF